MSIDPKRIAVEYYFGDLQYWKLPSIAANALVEGYDGPALRKLAALAALSTHDICAEDVEASDVDSAFREMGIDAPISKRRAQLMLATECAAKAISGQSNIFEAATHVRIHLCALSEPPEPLRHIVQLSEQARNAPRSECCRIETDLTDAFKRFLAQSEAAAALAALGGSDPTATAPPRRRTKQW